MLGILLESFQENNSFNELLYYKLNLKPAIEYSIENALKSEFAQKIVITMPLSERKNINGAGIYNPVIKKGLSVLNKQPLFYFYQDYHSFIESLYFAALEYGLDHIVLMKSNNIILPKWLINKFIYKYHLLGSNVYMKTDRYDEGFNLYAFPFWMLADAYIYSEDDIFSFLEKNYTVELFTNEENTNHYIINKNLDCSFNNINKANMFDFILNELALGADINVLLEDVNDK